MSRTKVLNRLPLNRKMSNEFLLTTLGQVLYLLQNLVQNKIFSSFFETSIYGKWSLLVSAYALVSMIPFSAIDQGIYKVAFGCRKEGNERNLYSLIACVYFLGFVLYSFIFIILENIQGDNYFAHGYGALFAFYAFTEILKNTFLLLDNAYRNRLKVFLIRLFGLVSRTVSFLILNSINLFDIRSVLWVMVVTNVVILFFEKKYFLNVDIKANKAECKRIFFVIFRFSAPLMAWAIFGWMQNMISRWYLDAILDLESVAMYSILTTLSYFVPNAVYTVVNAFVMPIVFEKDKAFTRKKLLLFLLAVAGVLVLWLLFVIVAGKYIIIIFSHAKYLAVLKYLPFTTSSAIVYVLSMLSTVEIYRRGETSKLLLPTIIPGLFMATIGYFLIKQMGFNGAIINYMLGHILYCVMTSFIVFNKKNIG